MVEPENKKDVAFRPKARLVKTIGGDLIKDEMAGVIELVKNGFDADAKKVTVEMVDLDKSEDAKIVIVDNGHGMDADTLLDDWMSPATGDKGKREMSPMGRPMLGRKGIGRFSAMRLGDELVLETVPDLDVIGEDDEGDEDESPEGDPDDVGREPGEAEGDRQDESEEETPKLHRLALDWRKFFTSDQYLSDVTFSYAQRPAPETGWQGTRLEISSLKDDWDEKRVRRLIRELKLLFSPIEHEYSENFEIVLDLSRSGLPGEAVDLGANHIEPYPIPDVTDYHLELKIEGDGSYEIIYNRNLLAEEDANELELSQEGESLDDLLPEDEKDLVDDDNPAPCGPLDIELYVWDRDAKLLEDKVDALQDAEVMGVRAVRRLLDDISGVSIYRDEFRVRPYGIDGDDWLGLGQRRVQMPATRLSENQLSGFVHFSARENPHLDAKSSREGLKENTAFRVLREVVRGAIGWLEPARYRFRQRNRLGRPPPESTGALEERRRGAFEELKETLERTIDDPEARQEAEAVAEKAEEAVEEEHRRLDTQAEILHDNHSLGLLARFVLHEGRNLDGTMDAALNIQERILDRLPSEDVAELEPTDTRRLSTATESLRESEARLSTLMRRLDPLTRKRRTRRPKTDPANVARKVKETFGPELEEAEIELEIPQNSVRVLAWEADLFHAFFNLFHNAIHWVQKVEGPNKIWLEVEETDDAVTVSVTDSGPGIHPDVEDLIFSLGYTEKTNGTGLGLFIAREAIERSKGTIQLVRGEGAGACFEIVLEEAE